MGDGGKKKSARLLILPVCLLIVYLFSVIYIIFSIIVMFLFSVCPLQYLEVPPVVRVPQVGNLEQDARRRPAADLKTSI